MSESRTFTVQEAANYLGVTGATIRNWINDGRLTWTAQRNPITGRLEKRVNPAEVIRLEGVMARRETRFH